MNSLRIVHVGDMHIDYDEKFKKKIEPSLNQILTYCREIKVNAVVIPGDLTHRKQSYSASSGVPMLINFLKDLSNFVDFIFIIKGNHDEPGSIALLHQLETNIFAYEYPVCLAVSGQSAYGGSAVSDLLREGALAGTDYIVSLIPYPTKSMFLSDDSIDNNNAEFVEKFEQVFELIGDVTQPYTCPKILGFHGNVVGGRLSSGQTLQSQDIMVAPSTLEKAKADYYALNHIHLRQEIKPNMIYAGGIANFNWGETEQKSFETIKFVYHQIGNILEVYAELILFTSARPMVTMNAEFVNGEFIESEIGHDLLTHVNPNNQNEYRLRIKVNENDRNLITEDKIEQLKFCFGHDVKIEFNIIPTERESRSEQIMHCKSLVDEVKEYAAISGYFDGYREEFLPISKEIETKAATLQEEVQL